MSFPYELENLSGLGVPAKSRFFENRPAVDDDLESSALRRNQVYGGFRVTVPQLSRQTGGSGFVVSVGAVLDGDVHSLTVAKRCCQISRNPRTTRNTDRCHSQSSDDVFRGSRCRIRKCKRPCGVGSTSSS